MDRPSSDAGPSLKCIRFCATTSFRFISIRSFIPTFVVRIRDVRLQKPVHVFFILGRVLNIHEVPPFFGGPVVRESVVLPVTALRCRLALSAHQRPSGFALGDLRGPVMSLLGSAVVAAGLSPRRSRGAGPRPRPPAEVPVPRPAPGRSADDLPARHLVSPGAPARRFRVRMSRHIGTEMHPPRPIQK